MKMLDTLRSVVRFGHIETDRVERRLAQAASVADLRRIAKRRLPGGVFDYIDRGAATTFSNDVPISCRTSARFEKISRNSVSRSSGTVPVVGSTPTIPAVNASDPIRVASANPSAPSKRS